MIDSHCHLADEVFGPDLEEVIDRTRDAGFERVLVILEAGNQLEERQAERAHALWPEIRVAVGVHPHQARQFDGNALGAAASVREQVERTPYARAVGEIGLDYHYDYSPRDTQRAVFERHIDLARRLRKPIIVHNRESTDDMVAILSKSGARGILHSYTESLDVAKQLIDLGYYISFSGIVTFRSAESLREVARALPHDRVLIETDTPYLAPVPFRGRDNEPAYVVKVAELLATLWNVPLERVAEQTTSNFEQAFSVRLPSS